MLQEELTADLRHLAAELDELGAHTKTRMENHSIGTTISPAIPV